MKANKPEYVWARESVRSEDECWPWLGSRSNRRYGRFFLNQKSVLAHRVVAELVFGPSDKIVMHKCNNMLCCNPKHLVYGDASKNARHAMKSGAFNAGKSGIVGVGFIASRQYWHAQGWRNGKRLNLYTGPSKEKALSARKAWEAQYHYDPNEEKDGGI